MKYLKKINELNHFNELEEFCYQNLSFLMDDYFRLGILDYSDKKNNKYIIILKSDGCNWLDIKADFIPFIELLCTKYHITNDIYFESVGVSNPITNLYFDEENIIDDDIDNRFKDVSIKKIKIHVSNK